MLNKYTLPVPITIKEILVDVQFASITVAMIQDDGITAVSLTYPTGNVYPEPEQDSTALRRIADLLEEYEAEGSS